MYVYMVTFTGARGGAPWEQTPGSVSQGAEVSLCPTIPYPQRSKSMSPEYQAKVYRQFGLQHQGSVTLGAS